MKTSPSPAPLRKRLHRREIDGDGRFITFSCYKRLPLLSTNPKIADAFVNALAAARDRHRFELFAYVVMPEHVHLLLRPTPGHALAPMLQSLKVGFSRSALAKWKKARAPVLVKVTDARGQPHFWQPGGGFDRNVRDLSAFSQSVHYIHENPVKRQLVAAADAWPWSSVHWWMKKPGCAIECDAPPESRRYNWAAWEGYRKWPASRALSI